jgi:hypothetical protein
MKMYTISYDLSNPGRDYDSITNAIKNYGTWWHQSGSVWLIATNTTSCTAIRDYLKQFMDQNDKIFVAQLNGEWAGFGFTTDEYNWIKNNGR